MFWIPDAFILREPGALLTVKRKQRRMRDGQVSCLSDHVGRSGADIEQRLSTFINIYKKFAALLEDVPLSFAEPAVANE